MLKHLFCKLFGLCEHNWEIYDISEIDVYDEWSEKFPVRTDMTIIYKCSKCHKFKKKKLHNV